MTPVSDPRAASAGTDSAESSLSAVKTDMNKLTITEFEFYLVGCESPGFEYGGV